MASIVSRAQSKKLGHINLHIGGGGGGMHHMRTSKNYFTGKAPHA